MMTRSFCFCSRPERQRCKKNYWAFVLLATLLINPAWADEDSLQIRFNTVGYLPNAEKQAMIAAPCANFTVVRVTDGSTVFKGKATGPVLDPDTQERSEERRVGKSVDLGG